MLQDILKYSRQIIIQINERERLVANGFFIKYKEFTYFVTVNHAIAPENTIAGKCYYILHENGNGLETKAIQLERWQFIDLFNYEQGANMFSLSFQFDHREDFAFCGIINDDLDSTETIPYYLIDDSLKTAHSSLLSIQLSEEEILPSIENNYYIAGRIPKQITDVVWQYKTRYHAKMKYIGQYEGLYEFKIQAPTTTEQCKGLSGSPVFDENINLIGMALRYREEDNVLRVFPARDILFYIRQDTMPFPDELN